MSPVGTVESATLLATSRAARGTTLGILHVASGDLWAGAEAMLKSLAQAQSRLPGVAVTVVLFNEGRLAQELRRSVQVIVLPEQSLNTFRLLMRLARVLRQIAPDVLHTHRIKEDIVAGLANLLTGRACCVRTAHGVDEGASGRSRSRGRLLDALHSLCVRHLFDSTFAVSSELRQGLAVRFPGARVAFVPNGIDVEELRSQARLRKPPERGAPVHVGIVGRLVPIKRVDVFLEMAALLQRSHPGAFFFSVWGDGPERAALEELTDRLQLRAVVRFAGFRSDMVAELATLDLLCVTSDSEGLPMVVLEAMAADVAVVAHAVGQIPDVLEQGTCGRLVDEHRPDAYAAAVGEILSDRERFARRTARASERVTTHFSAEACARSYLAQYGVLLESRRGSRS